MKAPRTSSVIVAFALVSGLLATGTSGTAEAQSVTGCAGNAGNSEVSEKGPYKIGEAGVVELESEVDGSVVQIGFVRPEAPADYKSPVIAVGSPYFTSDLRDVDVTTCNSFLVQNFVPHGYTIAFIPTRGAGGTDNCADLMGPAERSDLSQAVTWLGSQKWSNGNVGMTGASYDGSTPWEVAATGNPYLKTIVPVSGIHDIYDFVYGEGHNDWRWWFFVAGYYHYYGQGQANPAGGRDADRWANAWMCDSTDEALAATFESYQTGAHDSYGYWEARDTDDEIMERYRGSVLLVQGMQDWNVSPDHQWPFINDLAKKGVYVEQMLGQWDHTFPDGGHDAGPRGDYADILLEWWDRFLKEDESANLGPKVEVQDSDLKWRAETAFPPADTSSDRFYFSADNTLSDSPKKGETTALIGPGTRSRYSYIISDNALVYNDTPADHYCADCVTLSTTVEGGDLRITGIPEVEVRATPTGPGGFVSAYLMRVNESGGRDLIGWGAGDLRFPNGKGPKEVEPGTEVKLRFPLQPLDAVIHKGEELLLLFDQGNANHFPTAPFYPVELRYGNKLGSVEFETTTPDASDFFEPRGLPE